MTGQRHTEEPKKPEHYAAFLQKLKAIKLQDMSQAVQEGFKEKMIERVAWQKFDHEKERYQETTPMNSYDVLKNSQALFHLFEYMRTLLDGDERPPRYVEIDMKAFKDKEKEGKQKGTWPEEPPKAPAPRPVAAIPAMA